MEMYLAGVPGRRVEDIAAALRGARVSPSTVSQLNKMIYEQIEAWSRRPIEDGYPDWYLDGIVLEHSWAGEVRNVSVLVVMGVRGDGYRKGLGITEKGTRRTTAAGGAFSSV